MRELLFRGKRKDNGEWVEGCLLYDSEQNEGYIAECFEDKAAYIREVIPESISEYTGLTDKNGKKIFEGDICSFVDFHSGSDMETYCEGVWGYEDCYFFISDRLSCETTDLIYKRKFDGYIIGNIHDNPELLKGETDNG